MTQKTVCMIFLRHSALDCRIYYKEARTLRDAGYNVHLIGRLSSKGAFYDMGGNSIAFPDQNGIWEYDGMVFHGIKRRRGIVGKILEVRDLVRVGLELKADVYHCHESDIALSAAVKIKKTLKSSTKLIYDMHEFGPGSWKYVVKSGLKNIALYLFTCGMKRGVNCSDYLITANTIVRGRTLIFNRYKKVEILENAPVLSIFKDGERSKKESDTIVLCHEGAMGFARGLKEMVSLVERSASRIKLRIVGTVAGKEKKWVEAEIKDNPDLSQRIHITGWLPYEEVGNAISGCDIGLIMFHPTVNNMLAGPPNKLYNYMRYGMPVVSVDLPETRAIINKYRCGIIVKEWNVDSVIQAIHYLINHPEEAKAMGQRGKEAILNELSWEHQGEKLLKIYEELFNKKPFVIF